VIGTERSGNPPVDFLGAYEIPVYGIRRGKGGVYRPHNLPIVEAAVSAQDRLFEKYTVSIEKDLRHVIENERDDGDHGDIPKARTE
jgi:hypothetical protein